MKQLPFHRYRHILSLSWPIMLSFLSYQILGITDMLMVGQLGSEALAAVGLSITLMMFIGFPIEGFFDSSLVLLSKASGAKQYGLFKQILAHELILGFLLSLLGILVFPILLFVLKFMSPTDAVYDMGRSYLLLSIIGLIPQILSLILVKSLISLKQNKILAIVSNIVVLLNILLNYMFIFGEFGAPSLGVTGSALATLIAKTLQLLILGIYCYVSYSKQFREKVSYGFNKKITRDIFRLGSPLAQGNFLEIAGWNIFVLFISQLGVAAIAAHEIGMKIKDIAFMPGIALSSVATSLVGEAVGEKDYSKTTRHCKDITAVTVGVMGFVGVLIFLFPTQLVGLFTNDEDVMSIGVVLLQLLIVYQIIDAIFIILRGSLNGLGETTIVRNVLLVGGWFIMLPSAYIMIKFFNFGVLGAWLGLTLNVFISSIIMFHYFKKRNHQHDINIKEKRLGM